MKEDFLHYVWQYRKFAFSRLRTVQGESLQILDVGNSIQHSVPGFFNARIILENQKWAGNIEIHFKSSDWYLYHHGRDSYYDNVILHVVWKHDAGVFRKDNSEIPVLELCHFVSPDLIHEYQKLQARKSWINCEKDIKAIPRFLMQNWNKRLFSERLERKMAPINALLKESSNDWEATFFCLLAKNFGLNVNGGTFFKIARSIPFHVIRKESFDVRCLEALFFGQAGFLTGDSQDDYMKELKDLYDYLSVKYQLKNDFNLRIEFFRLRPDNFPTIRLGQLAMLCHRQRNLFSKIIAAKSLPDFYALFDISASGYWEQHYNFEKSSKLKDKSLSRPFVDLLIINTVIPFKYAYDMFLGKNISEDYVRILQEIKPEDNSVISKFKDFGMNPVNAFETQSLLQLKNIYCDKNRCLECVIGVELLKN